MRDRPDRASIRGMGAALLAATLVAAGTSPVLASEHGAGSPPGRGSVHLDDAGPIHRDPTRPTGGALRLPDPWRLLDVAAPWTASPRAPRGTGSLRVVASATDLYRDHRGAARHDVYLRDRALIASTRLAPGRWFGASITHRESALDQARVYGDDDRLDGGAIADDVMVAAGVDGAWGDLRAMAGLHDERPLWAASATLRGDGPLRAFSVRGYRQRTDAALAQEVLGVRVRFAFPARTTGADAAVTLDTRWGSADVTGGGRWVSAPDPSGTSHEAIDGWSAHGAVALRPAGPFDVRARGTVHHLGVALSVRDVPYASLTDLALADGEVEVGVAAGDAVRVAIGVRGVSVDAGSDGFADVWPFTPWDLFSATRYRLDALTFEGVAPYVAVDTEVSLGDGHRAGLDLALERWWGSGELRWREREAILPPFFYAYDAHATDLDAPLRLAGRIDLHARGRVAGGVALWGRAGLAVPLQGGDGDGGGGGSGTGSGDPDPGVPDATRDGAVWGGLTLAAGAELAW